MTLPAHIVFIHDHETQLVAASIAEVPGCLAQGATIDEARANLASVIEAMFTMRTEDGQAKVEEYQNDGYTVVVEPFAVVIAHDQLHAPAAVGA